MEKTYVTSTAAKKNDTNVKHQPRAFNTKQSSKN